MNILTRKLNSQSIDSIEKQIKLKNSSNPYFSTNKTVLNTITDIIEVYTIFRNLLWWNEKLGGEMWKMGVTGMIVTGMIVARIPMI
jgi:hypothetical protein